MSRRGSDLTTRLDESLSAAIETEVSTRVLVSLALTTILIGILVVGAVRWLSGRELINHYSTEVSAVVAMGWMAVGLGLVALVTLGILVLGDRTGLWALLNRPLVAESHPLSRLIRGLLTLLDRWDLLVGCGVIAVVATFFFADPLVRWILGATAAVALLLFLLLRRRDRR